MGDSAISSRDLAYRSILPSDFTSIKALHDDLFPVKYSNEFFQKACDGIGLHDGNLYTSIATDSTGALVGFVLAQLFPYPQQCEDKDLFSFEGQPGKVCYIITLGVIKSARKCGLGSVLIKHCADYASRDADCGAVYLHVLSTNYAALSFYQRNHYLSLRFLRDFYYFERSYHSAYLYILYLNGYKAPLRSQLWQTTSLLLETGAELLQALLAYLPLPAPRTFASSLPSAAGIFGTLSMAPALLRHQGVDYGGGGGGVASSGTSSGASSWAAGGTVAAVPRAKAHTAQSQQARGGGFERCEDASERATTVRDHEAAAEAEGAPRGAQAV